MKYYSHALLSKVFTHIKNGGVIAYPTEFCYGLGCDPFNYKAVNKIIKLKKRNKNKGLIVIAGDMLELKNVILPLDASEYSKIIHYWPGFYTLIMPANQKLIAANLLGKHNKVAVRVSKHKLVKQLCKFLSMPLVSTSANKSGYYPAKTYKECKKIFGHDVMVLPGNTNHKKRSSTIIDWATGKILR